MRNFLDKYWPIITLFFLSFLITWPVFVPGYFSHHDDLHVIRIFEMRKCFADFQIPCRWVPDMGFGNGYPLFNFYAPFAYYLGAIASFVIGYIGAAKLLFFLPLVFGGVGMYFLTNKLFGKVPGFVGGVLYLFAPYRALDAYVRGAVGESFALAIIPFVFYFFLLLIESREKKYFYFAPLTTAFFFVSHNIMTLIFTPLIMVWIVYLLYKNKWVGTKVTSLSLILAFCISAFFTLPAYFEKDLVQTEALMRAELDFRAQFVKVSQLFIDRSWNYSGSQPQSDTTISYQIGWPHWWLVLASVAALFAVKNKNRMLALLIFLIFLSSIFMTHNKSALIWENIKILAFTQFPWRFLSLSIFSASILGSFFVGLFKNKWLSYISIIIVLSTVLLNWGYFRPEHFYKNVTDESKLTGQSFIDQQRGALLDYLPKTALEPRELAPNSPQVTTGEATVSNFINKSDLWSFNVESNQESIVEVPVFDFPNWTVYVNQEKYVHTNKNILGRISVTLPPGEHDVIGKFLNTPIRTIGNILTVVSLFSLFVINIYGKNRKIFT